MTDPNAACVYSRRAALGVGGQMIAVQVNAPVVRLERLRDPAAPPLDVASR